MNLICNYWKEARQENDAQDEGISLDDVIAQKEFNGKILLRIPRELQADLFYDAKMQGVSMNQLCLFRLAQNTPRRVY
ncbi:MAG: type II toxin-antitoxin system HicB family antitoxin [Oscillospiraceae bacterium]|nr:type II toxin-antitoxin system HicB family antitoxin [Oscillospiraceae bacterium]